MHHFGAIFLGFIESFVVACILFGPNNAGTGLALAVICTFGLGLIPVLLVSWCVGALTLAMVGVFNSAPSPNGEVGSQHRLRRQRQLERYVQNARMQGKDDKRITQIARQNGWDLNDIEAALRA